MVIVAAADAKGVEAIVKRLTDVLEERLRHSLELGTALYPEDGADVHSLFTKATTVPHPLSLGGKRM